MPDLYCEHFGVLRDFIDEVARRALRDPERWPAAKEFIYDHPDQDKVWQFIEETVVPSPTQREKYQEDFVDAFREVQMMKQMEQGNRDGLSGLRLLDEKEMKERLQQVHS